MKKCEKCTVIKDFKAFNKDKSKKDGFANICKDCRSLIRTLNKKKRSEYSKRKYRENIEFNKLKNKKYREENPDKIKVLKKNYRINNKEKIKLYEQNNKSRINERARNRRKNYPDKRLRSNFSTMLWVILKKQKNSRKWENLLGYSLLDLKTHLESKFTKGMTWENYGKDGWHVDHIIPRSYFKYSSTDHPAFHACWALSNLQPLWATTEIAISYGEELGYIGNLDKNNIIVITDEIKDLLSRVNIVSV